MGVFAVLQRAVSDSFDVGLLLLVVLMQWGITYAFMDVFVKMFSSIVFPIILSGTVSYSTIQSFVGATMHFFAQPSNAVVMIVYGLLEMYLLLLVFSWIGKRRMGVPENPFSVAARRLIPAIIMFIIVYSPIYLLLFAIPAVPAGAVPFIFWTVVLLAVFYIPFILPCFAAIAMDRTSVSDAIRHGTFVGGRRYFTILAGLVLAVLVVAAVGYVFTRLYQVFPNVLFGYILYAIETAVYVILPVAVVAEVYVADVAGE